MKKKNYVVPRTSEIQGVLEPVLTSLSKGLCGDDCPECRDEWPVMPPDPEDDDF